MYLVGPAALFALVIGTSNVGLMKSTFEMHTLMHCTTLLWCTFFAYFIVGERPSLPVALACAGVAVGTALLIAPNFAQIFQFEANGSPFGAVFLNLLSAFASGIMIPWQRKACLRLRRDFPGTSVADLTTWKISLSLLALIPIAFFTEGRAALDALAKANSDTVVLVVVGIFYTVAFQILVVCVATFVLATSTGILEQAKVIPQLLLSALIMKKMDVTLLPTSSVGGMHFAGAVAIVLSAILYGAKRVRHNREDAKLLDELVRGSCVRACHLILYQFAIARSYFSLYFFI